jgi:uncharacterized protein
MGFNDVRVRHYDTYGKIEVPKSEVEKLLLLKDEVSAKMASLGFEKYVIDEEGLISGKLNRVIQKSNHD